MRSSSRRGGRFLPTSPARATNPCNVEAAETPRSEACRVRAKIRGGEYDGPTAALAPGYAQANLVVLPQRDAFDFLRFCVANPRPCPVLEVCDPGDARADATRARRRPQHRPAPLPGPPRRRGRRRGHRRPRRLARGPRRVPDRLLVHVRARAAGRRTARPAHRAGRQRADVPDRGRLPPGRPLRRPAGRLDAADDAAAGDPRDRDHEPLHRRPRRAGPHRRPRAARASPSLATPQYGDPVEIRDGEVPVFWACGVTPQAVAAASRPELMITHAPGHMFVTDVLDERLLDER